MGRKEDVGEVRLTNSIIQGDAFSPLLFVLMIDPLIKIMKKRRVGEDAEILDYMDDLKSSMTDVHFAQTVHGVVKGHEDSDGMVINDTKCKIQHNVEKPLLSLSRKSRDWMKHRTKKRWLIGPHLL